MSDFGKDLGVLHEACVTGRKVGAGAYFWGCLAASKNAFKVIKPLVQHMEVIERYSIAVPYQIPADADVDAFTKWLGKGCFTCHDEHNLAKFGLIAPKEACPENEKERSNLYRKLDSLIPAEINRRVAELGIHPAEILAVVKHPATPTSLGGMYLNNERKLEFENGLCVQGVWLSTAITNVLTQRQFIFKMVGTPRSW